IDSPVRVRAALAGIEDTALLVRLSMLATISDAWPRTETRRRLDAALDAITTLVQRPDDLPYWTACLATLEVHAHRVLESARTLYGNVPPRSHTDVLVWVEAPAAVVAIHLHGLERPDALSRRLTPFARSS